VLARVFAYIALAGDCVDDEAETCADPRHAGAEDAQVDFKDGPNADGDKVACSVIRLRGKPWWAVGGRRIAVLTRWILRLQEAHRRS
jgi:hypothetical protein